MYYDYDYDEPYLSMPFYPMSNDEAIDYSMTRQPPSPQHYPQHNCGPRGRWVPGRWVRRWVPGHCEYGRPGYGGPRIP